jgi:hypothetical protein
MPSAVILCMFATKDKDVSKSFSNYKGRVHTSANPLNKFLQRKIFDLTFISYYYTNQLNSLRIS